MLDNDMLFCIKGGAFSLNNLNPLSRYIEAILKLGQLIGSALRRSFSNNYCK